MLISRPIIRSTKNILIGLFALVVGASSCSKDESLICYAENIDDYRLNEIQIIASHNSYRKKTNSFIFNSLATWTNLFPADINPLSDWDYDHLPIPEQLDNYEIRGLEIDFYRDPEGGRFYKRFGNALATLPISSNEEALLQPGLKVLHIPDFDYETHHLTFIDALSTIKNWSDDHPDHFPLYILLEPKEVTLGNFLPIPQVASALEFDEQGFREIEGELRLVFNNEDQVIKPSDIRGNYQNLQQSIQEKGWPKIKDCRGKIIFVLLGSEKEKNTYSNEYNPDEEKLIFTMGGDEVEGDDIFYGINNPIGNTEQIEFLVNQGYIVRTRSDSGTKEARIGDYKPYNLGLLSGAQIISTDYYRPDPRHINTNKWTDFTVNFGDNQVGVVNNVIGKNKEKGCLINE